MKRYSLLAAMAMASSLLGTNSAYAGAEVGSWYVAPKAVYVDPDRLQRVISAGTAYKVDDALGLSLGAGKIINQNWDAELNYVYSVHGAGSSTATTSYKSWEGILNRVYMRDKKVNPFVGFGINSTTYSLTTVNSGQANTSRNWGYLLKTGVITDIKKMPYLNEKGGLQLVAEIGWRADGGLKGCDGGSNPCALPGATRYFENTFFGLGLHYNFGKHAESQSVPVAVSTPVVQTPAPEPKPVPPPPPADTDRDGVVDPLDRCANTPAGDKVDAVGCSLTMVLAVQFDTGKAEIRPEFIGKLDEFVQFMKDVPSAKGVLEGHTDNIDTEKFNQSLSELRAETVKAYVVSKGVDPSRIVTKGYGESSPIADNNTVEGRAINRRVVYVRAIIQ